MNLKKLIQMKCSLLLMVFFTLLLNEGTAQDLIQGSVVKGSGNSVDVWLKPNFSNSTKYLYQIGLPIAFPASADIDITDLTVTLDAGFVSSFGNNYSVGIASLAHNTANTVEYFFIYLIREGTGASNAQTWTSGSAFKVLNVAFAHSGSVDTTKIKLADFQDGGSNGQGNFYTVSGLADYYVTSNSIGNFYAISGQSTTGGNSSEGYAQTVDSVIVSLRTITPAQEITNNLPAGFEIRGIYPNPAKSLVKVDVSSLSRDQVTLLVTDLAGRVVARQSTTVDAGLNKISLDINNLANGSYFVRLVSRLGTIKSAKSFMKQ